MGAGTDPLSRREPLAGSAETDFRRERSALHGESDDPEVIAAEIDQTRSEMTETVDAIQHRLDPERVAEQAVGAATEATTQARDAAIEVTEQARDAAKEVAKFAIDEAKTAVRELTDQATTSVRASTVGRVEHLAVGARETAQDVGIDMLALIRQNPIPAALAAVGIGWLWMERSNASDGDDRQRQGYAYGGYRDNYGESRGGMMSQAEQSAGQMAGQAQQMADQVVGQAQQMTGQVAGQAQQAADQMQQKAQSAVQGIAADPIAVGALGLAMGAVAALLLPETEQERHLMGDARDRLMTQVQEKGSETLESVQKVAREAGKTVMEEAKAQGMGQESSASASPA